MEEIFLNIDRYRRVKISFIYYKRYKIYSNPNKSNVYFTDSITRHFYNSSSYMHPLSEERATKLHIKNCFTSKKYEDSVSIILYNPRVIHVVKCKLLSIALCRLF